MKNFVKGVFKRGKDTTIESDTLLEKEFINSSESDEIIFDGEVITKLSLHPDWELSSDQKYTFQLTNFELPPLKPNQISLSAMDFEYKDNFITATAFVRHSINKSIKLGESIIVFLNGSGNIVARQPFDLSALGELPANSSRPFRFVFDEESIILPPNNNDQEWALAFEINKPLVHDLVLHHTWEEKIPEFGKQQLRATYETLDKPRYGEVSFVGFQINFQENGNLAVSVFIRNGNDRDIHIEKLPLEVLDANGKTIAKGGFNLTNFTLPAQSTMPWSFIFPADLIYNKEPDFSRWAVTVPRPRAQK